ncbi:uncharacterized protein LOC111813171 [Octodon degus]|uniref:Uncharacterized protein LOC111813171 n=1 Tax=Octodon degus TaxID=10160 RepID=A0A6P6DGD9_OCTDE|nr:uncharacterized protein LOC111813171 [Octodon degus]
MDAVEGTAELKPVRTLDSGRILFPAHQNVRHKHGVTDSCLALAHRALPLHRAPQRPRHRPAARTHPHHLVRPPHRAASRFRAFSPSTQRSSPPSLPGSTSKAPTAGGEPQPARRRHTGSLAAHPLLGHHPILLARGRFTPCKLWHSCSCISCLGQSHSGQPSDLFPIHTLQDAQQGSLRPPSFLHPQEFVSRPNRPASRCFLPRQRSFPQGSRKHLPGLHCRRRTLVFPPPPHGVTL